MQTYFKRALTRFKHLWMNCMSATNVWILLDSFGLLAVLGVFIMEQQSKTPEHATPGTSLKDRVYAMLDHAHQHGHDIINWPIEDIICDLRAFADDVVESDEELHPHVVMWKATRRTLIA